MARKQAGVRQICDNTIVAREYAAVFRRSILTHRPSEVFEAVGRGAVLIEGADGQNLVVETEAASQHGRRVAEEAARVLALEGASPNMFPKLPGFAWTAALDLEDRAEMARSLREALRRALETESWDEYDLAWHGWRESARVLDDPELVARLLGPTDPAASVPLVRP